MDRRTILLPLLLSGCSLIPAVGPDYERPDLPTVSQWNATPQELFSEDVSITLEWWKKTSDVELARLIDLAIASNHSYLEVRSRVAEARAITGISRGDFFPLIGSSYTMQRGGRGTTNPDASLGTGPRSIFQAGLDASWEIDILGGNRRAFEASLREEEGVEFQFQDAGITLVAETARAYIKFREYEERLRVLQKNIAAQIESQKLAKAKFDSGMTSELDYAQSTAQVEATKSQLPIVRQLLASQRYSLAVLCGQEPISFTVAPQSASSQIPSFEKIVALTQPGDLIRNRPDIRSVESVLAAQTARVGVAISDLFPKITLVGSLGVKSTQSGSLFEGDNKFWSFSPGVTMPIFQGGKILSNIEAQDQRTTQALHRYQETVLNAIKETQESLDDYAAQKERVAALGASFAAAEKSLQLSRALYDQGMIDFLRVLEAEKTALNSEDLLIQGQAAYSAAAVSVYKAFAGIK